MITFSNIGNMGRLANQMFQFASTVGIARRNGYDVKFPIENFRTETPNSYNGCKLSECFDIPDLYLINSSLITGSIKYRYSETDFTYNKQTENIPDATDLYGYFQNEVYFSDSADEIKECFRFKESIIKEAENMIQNFEESVSIHIRRGDYLNQQGHHPIQSVDYYYDALKLIGSTNVFVFSDDIEWCKRNLNLSGFNFNFIDLENPYHSMYLMSKCQNNIIANSSFSWWAAWLNENQDKKIIGPKSWFGPEMNKDTSQILPSKWISI
jgi:hypothetical protein